MSYGYTHVSPQPTKHQATNSMLTLTPSLSLALQSNLKQKKSKNFISLLV